MCIRDGSKRAVIEQCSMEMLLGDDCEEKERGREEAATYIHLSHAPPIHCDPLRSPSLDASCYCE